MSTLILLDLKGTKKGLFFVVSVISFRYEGKTAALNKCMILCLLFIFKKLCLFTSTVSVSETVLSLSGLSHGALDCNNFVEKFLFFGVCVSLLL